MAHLDDIRRIFPGTLETELNTSGNAMMTLHLNKATGIALGASIGMMLSAAPAFAMGNDNSVAPGDAAPSRVLTTRDFFRWPAVGRAKISPGGQYIAITVPVDEKDQLNIADLATMHYTASYDMKHPEYVGDFYWVGDRNIVWNSVRKYGPLDLPVHTGNLMRGASAHGEGGNIGQDLFYVSGVRDSPTDILVAAGNRLYRENVESKELKVHRDVPYDDAGVLTDSKGNVRMVFGIDKTDHVVARWNDEKGRWDEISRTKADAGSVWPYGFSDDDKHVYVGADDDAPIGGMFQMDLDSGKRKLIWRDSQADIEEVLFPANSEQPAGVVTVGDYPEYHFFDESSPIAKTYGQLRATFPNCWVLITSMSHDGRFAVVSVSSDRRPADYYLYDLAQSRLQKLFSSRPWIDVAQMSEMTAFVIKTRDGVQLHGYLTIPRGKEDKNLPMIVLPHGGPIGVCDVWGFNSEVQFLAYHGYAVLQLNYRGSAGYGRDFERLGYGKWGTAMQDDLTDATHWAIQQGIADPKRICIYGASYGGYAAMMGVIREPDLFRCAASMAGPYDLTVQARWSDSLDTDVGRMLFGELIGSNKDDLNARSPVSGVERIKVPLFLAHGGKDTRVPIENLDHFASALDRAGKSYESLVKADELHGFYLERDQVEFHDRLLAFLDKYIGTQSGGGTAEPKSP